MLSMLSMEAHASDAEAHQTAIFGPGARIALDRQHIREPNRITERLMIIGVRRLLDLPMPGRAAIPAGRTGVAGPADVGKRRGRDSNPR